MNKTQWTVILAFAAVYIIWGSTYIALLIGIQSIPPFLLSALRFLFAGTLLCGWCLVKREFFPSVKSIGVNSVAGVLTLFCGTVSVAWAEQYISSSLAAIIVTAIPFWFIILDKKQWSFYLNNKTIIAGLLIGFTGVIILVGFDKEYSANNTQNNQLVGILAVIAGGIGWTSGSLFAKYRPTGSPLLVNTALQLLSAGVFCILVSYLSGEWKNFSFSSVSSNAWLALFYLATMGSIVAYSSYLFLLKVRPPALVSTYVYVNPIVALLLGAILVNEPVTWIKILALTIILGGVLLVNLSKYRTDKQAT